MAKTFEESARHALENPSVRSAELPPLIEKGEALRDEQLAIVARATEDSVNFALGEAERDEAAATADRARRNAAALANAVTALQAKLEERQSSEKAKADEAHQAEVIAARDALAERIRTEWPELERRIVELLGAIKSNGYGSAAEAMARGLPPTFREGTVALRRLTETKLPSFADRHNLAWPVATPHPLAASDAAMRQARLRAEQDRAAENARWSRFIVTPPRDKRVAVEARRGVALMVAGRSAVLELTAEQVKAAEQSGCTVERAKPGETIGTPAAVATF